jgi:hypothetical protein
VTSATLTTGSTHQLALMHVGLCMAIHRTVTVWTNNNMLEHHLHQVKRCPEKRCSSSSTAVPTPVSKYRRGPMIHLSLMIQRRINQ